MPSLRLLLFFAGLAIALGFVLWVVDVLSRLYASIAFASSPFLANLILLIVLVVLAALVAGLAYYLLWLPYRAQHRPPEPEPEVPEVKAEAAEETLRAIRQQVEQIQDEVTRQALLDQAREIEQNLARGNLQVVIFGTGSAGKTSLVNALMGRIVGRVSAPMGTTEVGETYSLKLKGVNRKILITDTPGILEAGVAGTTREQLARQLATEANLLVFVVDNDLRQSEYAPLKALVDIGKRSLLVFNKIDLYPEEDQIAILTRLKTRLQGLISPMDIVAIAANPQSVVLETGEVFQPEPEIMPLLRRMAAILRAEGEDLVADNILLQSQRLGDHARRFIDVQRRRQAERIVDRYQWIGAGVIAVTPLPVVDLLATAAVNAQMVVEIGRVYGCEINQERGRELALSLGKTLASLGIVKGVLNLVSTVLQLNLGTLLLGKAVQGVSAAYLTRIAGRSFIEYFRHNQSWGDGGMAEVVQRQFQLNRRDAFMKAFVQEAIAKVIQPLNLAPGSPNPAPRKPRSNRARHSSGHSSRHSPPHP